MFIHFRKPLNLCVRLLIISQINRSEVGSGIEKSKVSDDVFFSCFINV